MAVAKQNRDQHNSNPISYRRSSSDVGCAREEVSSIRDFFTERGKRPDNQQSKKRDLRISGNLIRQCWRRRRWPEKSSNRFDDELSKEDPCPGRDQSDHEDASPRCRPLESHCRPATISQPDRRYAEHKQNNDFIGYDVKNVVTNHDECAEQQLERAERSRGNWIGRRKWSFVCHRAFLVHSFITFGPAMGSKWIRQFGKTPGS